MMIAVYIVVGLAGLAVGVVAGYLIRRNLASGKLAGAERAAERVLRDANREAETVVKEHGHWCQRVKMARDCITRHVSTVPDPV